MASLSGLPVPSSWPGHSLVKKRPYDITFQTNGYNQNEIVSMVKYDKGGLKHFIRRLGDKPTEELYDMLKDKYGFNLSESNQRERLVAMRDQMALEDHWDKEDNRYLIDLMKIRLHLWT